MKPVMMAAFSIVDVGNLSTSVRYFVYIFWSMWLKMITGADIHLIRNSKCYELTNTANLSEERRAVREISGPL